MIVPWPASRSEISNPIGITPEGCVSGYYAAAQTQVNAQGRDAQ
jgi:hypothetical protein